MRGGFFNITKKTYHGFFATFVGIVGLLMVASFAYAAPGINEQIPYQGTLKTSAGVNVTDGNYDMVFTIYDSLTGGTTLWTGTHTTANGNAVAVKSGLFRVLLGTGTGNTMTLDFTDDSYFLGVTIGTDAEATPRQRIGATGYSFTASRVLGEGQSAIGTTSPIANTVATIEATSTSATALTIRGFASQVADLFRIITDTGSRLLTFTSGGNLGIGTTTPTEQLSLANLLYVGGAGTSTIENNLAILGGLNIGNSSLYIDSNSIENLSGSLLLQPSSGNVGIGNSAPTRLLHLGTDSVTQGYIRLESAGGPGEGNIYASSTGGLVLDTQSNLYDITLNGSNVILDPTSNVGIGTTTPGSSLSVEGTSYFTGTSTFDAGVTLTDGVPGITTSKLYNDGSVLYWNGAPVIGGGGSGLFATTSDALAVRLVDTTDVFILGANATTTTGNIFETLGNSLFRGAVTAYNTVTAPFFTATSTTATSTLPLLEATTAFQLGTDYFTDLTGTGLLNTAGVLSVDSGTFLALSDWYATTTDALAEGSTNQYYSSLLFAGDLAGTSTDALSEGLTNLYYTTNRFAGDLAATTTDALAQGSTNLYYSSLLFASDLAGTSTSALAEGTNLYYTDARVNAVLNASTTIPNISCATGEILEWSGTEWICGVDNTGSAGAGVFATTSDSLAIIPVDTTDVFILGANATTTTGNIFETLGNSLFRGAVTAYNTVTAPFFTATSTTATSTLPLLEATTAFQLGTDYFTDLTGTGLLNTAGVLSVDSGTFLALSDWYATTTDALAEGSTNQYYSSLLFAGDLAGTSTDALSEGVSNLYWTDNRFDIRLTATTTLPNISTLAGLSITESQISDLAHYTTLNFASDLAGTTTDALAQGSTNLYFTNALARSAISETIDGITYASGTGIFALDAGRIIPLTASTTNWNNFFDTPSTQITAGTGLTWTGNTLNRDTISLTTDVSGILPIANGGTNNSTAYTAGSVVFSDGTSLIQDNGNLFWDDANNRLGVGTTTPDYYLTVNGLAGPEAVIMAVNGTGVAGGYGIFDSSVNRGVLAYGSDGNIFTGASANSLSLRAEGDLHLGGSGDNLAMTLTGGNVGIGTTSPSQQLSVANLLYVGGVGTSTFENNLDVLGDLEFDQFFGSGTGTSTLAGGIDITAGCFSVNGSCVGGAGATTWGSITGTLSSQTDLQTDLDARLTLVDWYATTTDALAEGSANFYYTTNRFAADLAGTTTSALAEGTNLYYTDARVNTLINASSTIPSVGGTAYGDLLSWTGSLWETRATSTLGISLSDVSGVLTIANGGTGTTTSQAGGLFFSDGITFKQDTLNFFWDDTNNRLGIGTTSPLQALSVEGGINATGLGFYQNDSLILDTVTLGLRNTNVGVGAGVSILATGDDNVFVGNSAGTAVTTGERNTAIGSSALISNTIADNNTALGYGTLTANMAGTGNTAVGSLSLFSNTSASDNTAVGFATLLLNTTGFSNTAVGRAALTSNLTGELNTAQGAYALASNTTGSSSTAVGESALRQNLTGTSSTALGVNTLRFNSLGSSNTAIGFEAGIGVLNSSNISGNTLLGYRAGSGLLTGADYNTLLGFSAGDNITTGARNIIIGNQADGLTPTASDRLNIGNAIYGDLSTGFIGIGTSSPTYLLDVDGDFRVGVQGNSDALFVNASSGRVGIGSTSPLSALSIDNAGAGGVGDVGLRQHMTISSLAPNIWFDDVSSGADDYFVHLNQGVFTIGRDAGTSINDDFVLNAGNVGIGTTSPYTKLSVVGEVVGEFFTATSTTATSYFAGNVGVGSTSPAYTLSVNQAGSFGGAGLVSCNATTTKLGWDVGTGQFTCRVDQGAESVIHAYDSTGNVAIPDATPLVLNLDATTENSVGYTLAADVITFNETGLYMVTAYFTADAAGIAGAARSEIELQVQNDVGAGFVNVVGAQCANYMREQAAGSSAASCSVTYVSNYNATDDIRLQLTKPNTTDADTRPNASGVTIIKLSDEGADYAEVYYADKNSSIANGDLIAVDSTNSVGIVKSTSSYQSDVIGVISTEPGSLIGIDSSITDKRGLAVALTGRVPVKVNIEGGVINAGDAITSSSQPGVGMKAVKSGRVIGFALEGYSEENARLDELNGVNTQISVFINPHWSGGEGLRYEDVYGIGEDGELIIADTGSTALRVNQSDLIVEGNSVFDRLWNTVGKMWKQITGNTERINNLEAKILELEALIGNSASSGGGTQTTDNIDPNADTEAPEIIIRGENPVQVQVNSYYEDRGAYALDNVDDNLGVAVDGLDNIDTKVPNTFNITYISVDFTGNTAIATREVVVYDPSVTLEEEIATTTPPVVEEDPDEIAPEITLLGSPNVSLEFGVAYEDAGATATDNADGDISTSITTDNFVDVNTSGVYTIRYNVQDTAGNTADEVVRIVTVLEEVVPEEVIPTVELEEELSTPPVEEELAEEQVAGETVVE